MTRNVSNKSLSEVHGSVSTNKKGWRRVLAFLGPAYLVSVGYMDPGNWATDIAGGSQFGYALIWVLLMSNLMALLLQSLSARLGLVRQLDLAQASRLSYPPVVNFFLWVFAEIAIAATDLAEVLGMAIGLQLLFGLPLTWGVSLTVLDTMLLLLLQSYGMRKIEAFIISLVAIIGLSFFVEMLWAKPSIVEIGKGLIPSLPGDGALYIAIGIIGATVMPHNLYLHSSLVQTRRLEQTTGALRSAIKYNFLDSVIALNAAFFVNAAILILAASTFFRAGMYEVSDIQDAYNFLTPMLGTHWASILFGVALVAAGQSSTITGTLAGQIVMEGYLNLRITPWLRRLITRMIAIIPAYLVIIFFGEGKTGDLLVFSQVVLSLQLGFAILPLIHLTSDKQKMGTFAIKPWVKIGAWIIAIVIIALNVQLVIEEYTSWLAMAGSNQWALWTFVFPVMLGAGGLLLYVAFKPAIDRQREKSLTMPHGTAAQLVLDKPVYRKIAVSLDFTKVDAKALESAMALGGTEAEYLIMHVVESAGALWYGSRIADRESAEDQKILDDYKAQLERQGYRIETCIGYGTPRLALPKLVKSFEADILVMGAHGHHFFKDLIFGETVNAVRHKVKIPLLVVRNK